MTENVNLFRKWSRVHLSPVHREVKMSFDALARDGQGTENLRLLCRFGNGQEGVMGRQKIVLENYSTHIKI